MVKINKFFKQNFIEKTLKTITNAVLLIDAICVFNF